jgi:hypothetical protein
MLTFFAFKFILRRYVKAVTKAEKEEVVGLGGKGLNSSTFQLHLSRYVPDKSDATQHIPRKVLTLS